MDKLTNVILKPLKQSKFMKPLTLFFQQNGQNMDRDFLAVHDGVAVVLFNVTRNVLIFVEQFRPAVYIGSIPVKDRQGTIDENKYPATLGITTELCAGIVDKELSLPEIAAEEVFEECGYKVSPTLLEKVSSYRSGSGRTGSIQTLYYCEVTDEMKVSKGGGVNNEIINVVEMSVSDLKKFLEHDHILSPPSFLYGTQWFLAKKGLI